MNDATAQTEKPMADFTFDSLLDADLNDFLDLPGFEPPPVGHYKLKLVGNRKKINDHPAIEFKYTVLETLELADLSADPVKIGHSFSEAFQVDNEVGQGFAKAALLPISKFFGITKMSDLFTVLAAGIEITGVVKHVVDRKDSSKVYGKVVNISLV